MGLKTVSIRHDGGLRFVTRTGSGHELAMDNATGDTGPRPTEVLLAALGVCTAMDVASILEKKRQAFDSYEVVLEGIQRETSPSIYTDITIHHTLVGAVDTTALARAIELSAEKYCTISAQLSAGPTVIHHRYMIRSPDAGGADREGEVCVTGPMREGVATPT